MRIKYRLYLPLLFMLLTVITLFSMQQLAPKLFSEVNQINQITGYQTIITKVNIITPLPVNCSFDLNQGWNLVSFYCITFNESRNNALQSINNSYNSIFSYVNNDSNHWKIYNPYLPNWTVQQIETLSRTQGYWIDMSQADDLVLEGKKRKNNSIFLIQGWNLVGYPTNETRNITQATITINGNYSFIRMYNASAGTWWIYAVNGSSNTLNNFYTNYGYWINITNNDTWVVDW